MQNNTSKSFSNEPLQYKKHSKSVPFECPHCHARSNGLQAEWYDWNDTANNRKGGWVVICPECGSRLQVQLSQNPTSGTGGKGTGSQSGSSQTSPPHIKFPFWRIVLGAVILFLLFGPGKKPIPSVVKPSLSQEAGSSEEESKTKDTSLFQLESGAIAENYGNTFINISEGGFMVADEDYIYYTNSSDDFTIYRMNHDMDNKEQICPIPAFYLNLYENKLYFGGAEKGHRQLFELDLNDFSYQQLCKEDVYEPKVVDGVIYYENVDDNYSLWRYNISAGGPLVKICDDYVFYCCISDDSIYYLDPEESYKAYRVDIDCTMNNSNSKEILFPGEKGREFCYADGVLYRSLATGGIYAYDTRTEQEWKISGINARSMNVYGDTIYFANADDNETLYKMGIDGSNPQQLSSNSVSFINVYGNLLCYRDRNDEKFYWMLNEDGKSILVK